MAVLPHRALVLAATLLAAESAHAQTSAPTVPVAQEAEARSRFERGLVLSNGGDYNGALAEFQASYAINHRASTLYNIGVAQQELHHYPEAARAIEQYLREARLPSVRRIEVERGLAQIQTFIAHVRIGGLPAGAIVRIDGTAVGRAPITEAIAVGTGYHSIEASADGFQPGLDTFSIAAGQERDVELPMRPLTPSTSLPVPTPAALVAPVPVPVPSEVRVRVSPPAAMIRIDARPVRASDAVLLAPGAHRVEVSAAGYRSWQSDIATASGLHRTIDVRLVRTGGPGPGPFVATAAGTAVVLAGALVCGALASATHAQFAPLDREDPRAAQLAQQGTTEQTLANALFVAAGVTAVAAIVLLTQTRFGSSRAAVTMALQPALERGAETFLRVRF